MTPYVALRHIHSFVNMKARRGAPEDGKTRVAFYEDKYLQLTVTPYGISVIRLKNKMNLYMLTIFETEA